MDLPNSSFRGDAPRTLGRHKIIAKMGRGGMADVYLTVVSQQHSVSKLYVIKVLREDLGDDRDFQAMFVKEARIATLLHHRNLVQTFEVDEADGHHYMTMEYLDGRPLHQLLAAVGREAMPLSVHVEILALALAGLHAAHDQKDLNGQNLDLVHRDVSPQNVFVTYDGEVKVVDFGVAKARGIGAVTETGALMGKIGYMAPEQALSHVIDRRADVFAVGIMLWEALARRRFLDRDDGEAVALRKRLNGEIPSPRSFAPDAPGELIAICERAIAYEPSDRFVSAAEFEETLRGYLEKSGARISPKDIAGIVTPPFEAEREQIRSLIEEQLTAVDHVGEVKDLARNVPRDGSAADAETRPQQTTVRTRPRKVFWVAIPATALVLVLLFVASRTPWRGGAVSAAAPSSGPVASVLGASAPAPRPAVRTSVRVRLRVTPPSAILAFDGRALAANPFTGDLPMDSSAHVLTASADGYATVSHDVRLDSDVDVDLSLVPLASKAPSVPARGATRTAPTPNRRSARPVDDNDPYAQ